MFKYPHGDLHGLNLDWLLEQWKKFQNSFTGSFTASTETLPIADDDATVNINYDMNTGIYDFHFGMPARIKPQSFLIGYQESADGTTIPTGTWLANPPAVAQGNYLWSKTQVIYNDGQYSTTYSCARMGTDGAGSPASPTDIPIMDSVANVGVSGNFARADHVHPSDTTKLNTNQLSNSTPVMDGTATAGTATTISRSDHKHPTDTSRASQSDMTSITGRVGACETDIGALQTRTADKVLFFQNCPATALTGTFATVTNAKITEDYVIAYIEFANPQYIHDYTWTTSTGSFTLSGTCDTGTTFDLVLIRKDN